MNINESILSKLTDEQKKKALAAKRRKSSWPLQRRPAMNCPGISWISFQAAGIALSAE